MVGSGPNQAESIGSQRENHFVNLERRRDREVSVHTIHTSRSSPEMGATFLMKRILEPCNWRLII